MKKFLHLEVKRNFEPILVLFTNLISRSRFHFKSCGHVTNVTSFTPNSRKNLMLLIEKKKSKIRNV